MEQIKSKNKIIISCVAYIVAAFLFVLVRIGGKFGWFAFMGSARGYIINLTNQLLFLAVIPLLIVIFTGCKKEKITPKELFFTKIPAKIVGNSVLLGFIMFGIVVVISTLWSGIISLTGYETPFFNVEAAAMPAGMAVKNFFIDIVMVCLVPAICEEILLRGCILSGFKDLGRKRAIIFCGLLFGLLHININQFGYTAVMGMILSIITLMTGSIYPAMIIHFTSNFCSVFSTFIGRLNLFGGGLNIFVNSIFSGNIISVILNMILISVLLFFLFVLVFAKFVKYSRSKMLYNKLQSLVDGSKLKEGQKFEINEQTSDALIQMKTMVEGELVSQLSNIKKPFDFILPPMAADKYKPTKLQWTFIILAFAVSGIATLVSFIGGGIF